MRPEGEAAFAARRDDRTAIYSFDGQWAFDEAAEAALQAEPAAWAFFETLPKGYRRLVTQWVMSAKRPETREKRLGLLVASSARGERTGPIPASTVQCPAQVNIGGRTFHNFDNEHLGSTSLQTAFAVSCNSTFITLATQRLNGSKLASSAATFGFNSGPTWASPPRSGGSPRRKHRSTWRPTPSAREPTWSIRSARHPWRAPSKTAPGGRRSSS